MEWALLALATALAALVSNEIARERRWRKRTAMSDPLIGVVQNANATGLRLVGETKWRNYTTQREVQHAEVGDEVELQVSGDWINALEILATASERTGGPQRQAPPPPRADPNNTRDVGDNRTTFMARCSALKSAAKFTTGRPCSTADLLSIADALYAWLTTEPN